MCASCMPCNLDSRKDQRDGEDKGMFSLVETKYNGSVLTNSETRGLHL